MENKITVAVLTTAFALPSLLSCHTPDLIPEMPILEYSIIDGDTLKTDVFSNQVLEKIGSSYNVYSTGIFNETRIITSKTINLPESKISASEIRALKNLKNSDKSDNELEYVDFGSSLTAGVRDGGYFNEGIKTSFPAILANHFGIKSFSQPLFEESDYNGYGRTKISEC